MTPALKRQSHSTAFVSASGFFSSTGSAGEAVAPAFIEAAWKITEAIYEAISVKLNAKKELKKKPEILTPLPRQQKTIVRKALRMVNSLSSCRGAKVPSNQGLTQVYATIRYDTPASAALEPLCATWRNMQHVTGKHALDIFWPWKMFRIQLSRKFCEMYIGDHRLWWRAVEFHGMTCGPNAQLSMKNEFCIMLLYILPCIHTHTIWQIFVFSQ